MNEQLPSALMRILQAKRASLLGDLFSAAEVGLWDWDVSTGRIVADPVGFESLGVRDAAPHMNFEDWLKRIHPDDLGQIETLPRKLSDAGVEVYELEYRVRHDAGRWLWIRSNGIVLERDNDGRPLRICGCHQNIHELKKSTLLLQAEKESLDSTNRILVSMQSVNSLLVEEHDLETMLQQTCEILAANPEFQYCMILMPRPEMLLSSHIYQAGLETADVEAVDQHLRNGSFPSCIDAVAATECGIAAGHPVTSCNDCPFQDKNKNRNCMAVHLEHEGHRYGVLTFATSVPPARLEKVLDHLHGCTDNLSSAIDRLLGARHKQWLHKMVNAVHDPIAMISRTGCYLSVNQAYARLYGCSASSIVGKTVVELIGEERFRHDVKPYFDQSLKGEVVRYEIQSRFPARDLCCMQIECIPFYSAEGDTTAVIVHGIDISEIRTQQHQLEETIQELNDSRLAALNMMEDAIMAQNRMTFQNALFDSFMDTLPALVFFKDSEGRLISVNKAFGELLGIDPATLIGKTASEIFGEEIGRKLQADEQQVMKTGQTIDTEHFVGGHWWHTILAPRFNETGQIIGNYGISRDISARKEAETKLMRSREQFSTLLSNLPGMAYRCEDDANWTMRFISDGCIHVTGYEPQELTDNKMCCYNDLIHPDDRRMVSEQVQAALKEKMHFEIEYRIISRNGEEKWVWERGIGRIDDLTGSTIIEGFISDMTARKATEQKIADLARFPKENTNPVARCDRKFRLLYANPAAESLLSFAGRAIGQPVADPWKSMIKRAFETEQSVESEISIDACDYTVTLAPVPERGYVNLYARDITALKQAQNALRKNEEHLRTTLDSIGDAVISTDSAALITNINAVAEQLTGWKKSEAIGSPIEDVFRLIHEKSRLPIDNPVNLVLRSDEIIGLTNHALLLTRDGREIPVADSASPIRNAHKEMIGVVMVFRDQSAEREARNKVETSERLLRSIIDTIPSYVWWKDVDCQLVGTNYKFSHDVGGENSTALIGKNSFDLFEKEWAQKYDSDDRSVLQSGRARIGIEEPIKLSDGNIRWLEANKVPLLDQDGQVVGMVGTATDITERKKSEIELQRLSTAIEQSPEAIIITAAEGTIQYVNPTFEANTGYSRAEAVGENPRILKSGEQESAFYQELWKTISTGKVWEGRLVNKRKDGTLFTEEASIAPVRNANGEIINYVAIKRDISLDLIREEKIRQGQKMEAIGLLAGGVAHDFNNILQAILGFSELLILDLEEDSLSRQNATEIKHSASKAAGLTQQLLAFSRKKPVDTRLLDMNESVHEAEALITILLGEQYNLELKLADGLPRINMDAGQLTQVIMNLAVNARDAMPRGGRLTITTESVFLEEADVIWPESRPGSFVCLSMTDTGSGIDQHMIPHLFDPFFTTKEVGKGTGLGLSVVYGIMQQCEGWISVYSEKGHGSTFRLNFPSIGNPSHNVFDSPAAVDGDTIEVLVVDDDPEIRSLIANVLEETQFRAVVTGSVAGALELFEQDKHRFGLLLTDMHLPDGSGLELANRLRADLPRLPVLLSSGYHDQLTRWKNLKNSNYQFINKPFTIIGLTKSMCDTIAKAGTEV